MYTPLHKLGDFEVLHELGRGGMGIVYEARQVSLNRKVALKVLSGGLGLTGKAVTRFKREAEAAAKLHHTNIVPIYATGEEDGTHFYAMELIEGPSLDKVIKQMRSEVEGGGRRAVGSERDNRTTDHGTTGPIADPKSETKSEPARVGSDESGNELAATVIEGRKSEIAAPTASSQKSRNSDSSTSLGSGSGYFDTVARMLAEVADALDYAHKQGVIHRDIKPSNLLLSLAPSLSGRAGGELAGRLSINDFGLARMLEEPGMTISGEFLGSPSYMSPEQIAAGRLPLDHRTDIYSLGVVLYELLALQPPFIGQSRDQVLAQIVQKEPKPPRSLNKKVPLDLETICLKAIEKDPDRRYQNASAMAEDLRRFVNRFAISARRASVLQRAAKWTRRHPSLAFASVIALLLACLALHLAHQRAISERMLMAERQRQTLDDGLLRAMSGDLEGTKKAIAQAEIFQAHAGQVRMLRSIVALHTGDYSEAIEHAQQAVQLMPESVAAWAVLCRAGNFGGQWPLAMEARAKMKSLPSKSAEDYTLKAYGEIFPEGDETVRWLDKAVSLRPNFFLAYAMRAEQRAVAALDNPEGTGAEAAAEDARLAKAMLPQNAVISELVVRTWMNLAMLSQRHGDSVAEQRFWKLAEDELARVRGPSESISRPITEGFYWLLRGEFDRALELARQSASQSVQLKEFYADLLYRAGELRDAKAQLEEIPANIKNVRTAWREVMLTAELDGVAAGYERYLKSTQYEDLGPGWTLLLRFLGQNEEASRRARQFLQTADSTKVWSGAFAQYEAEQISEQQFLQSASGSNRGLHVAHSAIGMRKLSQGDREAALVHFKKCLATRMYMWFNYGVADLFVRRLERDPNWPPWIPVKN